MLNTKMINLEFTDVKNCEKQEVNNEEDDDPNTRMGCAISKIFYVFIFKSIFCYESKDMDGCTANRPPPLPDNTRPWY